MDEYDTPMQEVFESLEECDLGEEKKYEAELIARGMEKERIRKYGFAFEGKQVLIG